MADNAIERIREAELKADDTIRGAHEQAAAIVEAAKKEAELLLRACEDSALAQGDTRLDAIAQQNAQTHAAASGELEAEMERLTAGMRARQPLAVQALIDTILS